MQAVAPDVTHPTTMRGILASVLLMVFVARGYGSRRPLRDAIVALAVTVPIWVLFSRVMGISLPLLPLLKS